MFILICHNVLKKMFMGPKLSSHVSKSCAGIFSIRLVQLTGEQVNLRNIKNGKNNGNKIENRETLLMVITS